MKYFLIAIAGICVLAIASIFLLPKKGDLALRDSAVIATEGIHWHPELTIYVKGERIAIPQNVGVGSEYRGRPGFGDGSMAMTAIHTHDDLPLIHLEFTGVVRTSDIALGKFFEVWGKDMRTFGENMRPSDERGSAEASGLNVRMTVNGEPNSELGNYVMRDGDKIELHYD